MCNRAVKLVVTALIASVAPGQIPAEPILNRVFQSGHTQADQDLQEIVTVIRGIADVRQASIDNAPGSVAVQGTAAQVAVAEWLFYELDKPASRVTPPPTREYRYASDDIVRVFYLSHAGTPRDLQEIATNVRATADIRRVFLNSARGVVVVRATANQIGMAEWLLSELDKPAGLRPVAQQGQSPAKHEYRVPGATDDVLRVFYLRHARTAQDLQDIATLIRATADIRRVFTSSARTAVVSRGTASQIGMAEWLVDQLDRPASRQPVAQQGQQSATHEYRLPGEGDDVVRVFYLPPLTTDRDLRETAAAIRAAAGIRRSFIQRAQRAVVLRGTVSQLVQAESLIKERDKANSPNSAR
ncbi:MAG: hypothetical protein AAB225_08880 [Acidobacteriota bacterium]